MALVWTALSLAGAALVFLFVLSPLRDPRQAQEAPSAEAPTPDERKLTELIERREAALAGLAELDFDRNLGNLSEADYEHLRTQYRAQAIGILQDLDKEIARGAVVPAATLPESIRQALPGGQTATRQGTGRGQAPASAGTGRAIALISGAIAVALLAIGLGTAALRGVAAPSAEDAPTLDVLATHAALLLPGTQSALVGHHSGLLRSDDAGRSWQPVMGIVSDVIALTSAPVQGAALFLATPDSVLRSDDAGLTWKQIPSPKSAAKITTLAVGEGNPLPLYAGVADAGLFRTTDFREWRLVGGGLPEEVSSMVWRPGPLSALYAAGPQDGIIATGDDGQTWGSANGQLNGVLPTRAVRSLAVDPNSGDRFTTTDGSEIEGAMYAATDLGLYKSIDGGSSWSPMPLGEPLAAVSASSIPTAAMLAVDSRGRVWRSSDRGATWSAKP